MTNHSCGVDFFIVQACYSYDKVVSHSACLDSFTGVQINKLTNCYNNANYCPIYDHLNLTFDVHEDQLRHNVQSKPSQEVLDVSDQVSLKSNIRMK